MSLSLMTYKRDFYFFRAYLEKLIPANTFYYGFKGRNKHAKVT